MVIILLSSNHKQFVQKPFMTGSSNPQEGKSDVIFPVEDNTPTKCKEITNADNVPH